MIVSHIVAMAKNRVIGIKGHLPWSIPEDMRFFRQKTLGHILIMGRKTYESLPKFLDNRLLVVITQRKKYKTPEKVHVVHSVKEALDFSKSQVPYWKKEIFVIGGGEIYQQTLDQTDRIYITEIDENFNGDTKYPLFEKNFLLSKKKSFSHPIPFSFCFYERILPSLP